MFDGISTFRLITNVFIGLAHPSLTKGCLVFFFGFRFFAGLVFGLDSFFWWVSYLRKEAQQNGITFLPFVGGFLTYDSEIKPLEK